MKFSLPVGLAPMAGLTHRAFRRLVAEIGGAGLFYTEMLNSRVVATQNPAKDPFCQNAALDMPLVAQIVGGDPNDVARAIRRLEPLGFHAFDINMGCPQKRLTRHGWGAALARDPKRAIDVVRAARKATRRPIFVKTRSFPGHDTERLLQFLWEIQKEGVDLVCLHPRTVEDGFKRSARWEEIREAVRTLSIPVFGNGDVFSKDDMFRMKRLTDCAGILVGRGALVRPWVFFEAVTGRRWPGDPLEVLEKMGVYCEIYSPRSISVRHFTLFLSWFLRNWAHHHYLFSKVRTMGSIREIVGFLIKAIHKPCVKQIERPILNKL